MNTKSNFRAFFAGLFSKNPVFFLLLGLCPTLAVTTSVENGIGMGLATAFVLIFSSIIISLLKHYVRADIRIPAFIVIIASLVTIVSMLMEAFFPAISASLGIYLPLIVVNCIVLGRALAFAYKNPMIPSFFDAAGMGIGFTGALIIISGIREILGTGRILLSGDIIFSLPIESINIMILPPGALLTLGLILGFIKAAGGRKNG